MFSHWAYILIGNNNTGKTNFQKYIIYELCGPDYDYENLPCNLLAEIIHPQMPRGVAKLSIMNRSYQEKLKEYVEITKFFSDHFKEAEICILSSHAHGDSITHISDMIRELRLRAYNVAAVFFSNGYNDEAKQISLLDWDERLWIDNPILEEKDDIQSQLERLATEFVHTLIARAAQH